MSLPRSRYPSAFPPYNAVIGLFWLLFCFVVGSHPEPLPEKWESCTALHKADSELGLGAFPFLMGLPFIWPPGCPEVGGLPLESQGRMSASIPHWISGTGSLFPTAFVPGCQFCLHRKLSLSLFFHWPWAYLAKSNCPEVSSSPEFLSSSITSCCSHHLFLQVCVLFPYIMGDGGGKEPQRKQRQNYPLFFLGKRMN